MNITKAHPVNKEEEELLGKFREKITGQRDFVCPLEDDYLLAYLRHRNGDLDRAFSSLKAWWAERDRNDEFYSQTFPSLYHNYYNKGHVTLLKHPGFDGRKIVLYRPKFWDPSKINLVQVTAADFPFGILLALRQSTQINGIIYIVDLEGFSLSQLKEYGKFSSMKMLMSLIQQFPLKWKAMHFVSKSSLLNIAFNFVNFCLTKKAKDKFHFHGYNYSELHEFVDPKFLPKQYGGSLNEGEWEEEGIVDNILSQEEYLKDLLNPTKYGGRTGKKN